VSSIYDTEKVLPPQGVYWNEEDWQGLLKRLPNDWEEQAIRQGAWQRVRQLARITDLLRGLLVYGACGYSFGELGLWATLVGIGSLSERAWRKRVQCSAACRGAPSCGLAPGRCDRDRRGLSPGDQCATRASSRGLGSASREPTPRSGWSEKMARRLR
jgi:hypothetical protein